MSKKSRRSKLTSLVFFGTATFAVPNLYFLVRAGYPITLVVTQPDRMLGKRKLEPSPVKTLAQKLGLPLEQPSDLMQIAEKLRRLKPELFIVVAYGQIIPKEILDLPRLGALNIHGSLLPKYRGASPIQTAILNGEKETGVTLMLMDEKLDHGPILAQASLKIESIDTYESLSEKLAKLNVGLLDKTLPLYLAGEIKPQPQNHQQATLTKLIRRDDGLINWQETADDIERRLRAFTPWPDIYVIWHRPSPNQPLRLKIIALTIGRGEAVAGKKPGVVFKRDKKPAVACNKNSYIVIEKIQPAGKREMTGKEFLNGYRDFIGANLA